MIYAELAQGGSAPAWATAFLANPIAWVAFGLMLVLLVPGATKLLSVYRGHELKKDVQVEQVAQTAEEACCEVGELEKRVELFENLTDRGDRLKHHFQQIREHTSTLQRHDTELEQGGRRLTAMEKSLQEHRVDFGEFRGEISVTLKLIHRDLRRLRRHRIPFKENTGGTGQ